MNFSYQKKYESCILKFDYFNMHFSYLYLILQNKYEKCILKYSNFNERIQQITKIWKNLPTSKKQSFTAQARENHVSSRKSKATKSNVISNNLKTSSFKPSNITQRVDQIVPQMSIQNSTNVPVWLKRLFKSYQENPKPKSE